MLSAEIISALIKLSLWIKPGLLIFLLYFIVGALEGKERVNIYFLIKFTTSSYQLPSQAWMDPNSKMEHNMWIRL